jgi:tetratricopeptide (TPR) repeat protein
MLQGLLDSKRYDELLKISQSIALTVDEDDIRFALSSYYGGVASFRKRKFKDSIKFFQNYRSSVRLESFDEMAEFYWASNLIELDYKIPALRSLDEFIEKYPDSYFYPEIIYRRATILFLLNKFDESIKSLEKLGSYKIGSDLKTRIHLLKGKSLMKLSRLAESEAEFLNAKISTQQSDQSYLNEALSYLVKLSNLQYRWDDSVSYYGEFNETAASTIHKLNAAAYVMGSMEQMDRINEGIEGFEDILTTLSVPFLHDSCDEAMSIYAGFLIKKYGHEKSISRVGNIMSESSGNESLIEVLAMIGLDIIEQSNSKRSEEIRAYYESLVNRFRINGLSNNSLLKIAKYFSTTNYEVARDYYNEVLKREDYEFSYSALLGLFKIYDAYEEIELIDSVSSGLNAAFKINGMSFPSYLTPQDRNIIDNIIGSDLSSDDEVIIKELDKLVFPKRSAIRKISKVN